MKREREQLGTFIYENIPKMSDHVRLKKVIKNALILFEREVYFIA